MRIKTASTHPASCAATPACPTSPTCRTRRMAAPGEDPPPGEPGIELDRIQAEYNSVRLHAAIGYVTRRRARGPRRSDPPGRRDGSPRRGWTASHTVGTPPRRESAITSRPRLRISATSWLIKQTHLSLLSMNRQVRAVTGAAGSPDILLCPTAACHSNAISRTVAGTLPLSAESAARPRPSAERESAAPRITAPWRIP